MFVYHFKSAIQNNTLLLKDYRCLFFRVWQLFCFYNVHNSNTSQCIYKQKSCAKICMLLKGLRSECFRVKAGICLSFFMSCPFGITLYKYQRENPEHEWGLFSIRKVPAVVVLLCSSSPTHFFALMGVRWF